MIDLAHLEKYRENNRLEAKPSLRFLCRTRKNWYASSGRLSTTRPG